MLSACAARRTSRQPVVESRVGEMRRLRCQATVKTDPLATTKTAPPCPRRTSIDRLTETGGALFTWPQGSLFQLPFPDPQRSAALRQSASREATTRQASATRRVRPATRWTRRRRASHRPESAFPRERAGRREALTGQVSATLLAPRTVVRPSWRTPAGCASPRKQRNGWRVTPGGSS